MDARLAISVHITKQLFTPWLMSDPGSIPIAPSTDDGSTGTPAKAVVGSSGKVPPSGGWPRKPEPLRPPNPPLSSPKPPPPPPLPPMLFVMDWFRWLRSLKPCIIWWLVKCCGRPHCTTGPYEGRVMGEIAGRLAGLKGGHPIGVDG